MRGFTLIETVIYIGLFGLIMGGTLMAVYQLLESSSKISTNTVVQEEGNFVLRKLDWALSSATTTSANTSVVCAHTLHVVRNDGMTVDFRRDTASNTIEMSQNGGAYAPITTGNVTASCLKFNAVTVGSITGITGTTTLSGLDFATTKYIRK